MSLAPEMLLCCAMEPAQAPHGDAPVDVDGGDVDSFLIRMPAGAAPGSAVRAQAPAGGPIVNVLLPDECAAGQTLRVRIPSVLESLGAPVAAVPFDAIAPPHGGLCGLELAGDARGLARPGGGEDVGVVLGAGDPAGISSAWALDVSRLALPTRLRGAASVPAGADHYAALRRYGDGDAARSDAGREDAKRPDSPDPEGGELIHGPGGARKSAHPARPNIERNKQKRDFYLTTLSTIICLVGGIVIFAVGIAVYSRSGSMRYLMIGGCLVVVGLILAGKTSGQLARLRLHAEKRKKKHALAAAIDSGPYRGPRTQPF